MFQSATLCICIVYLTPLIFRSWVLVYSATFMRFSLIDPLYLQFSLWKTLKKCHEGAGWKWSAEGGGNEWGLRLGRLPSSDFYTPPFCFVFAPSSTREPVHKLGSIISFWLVLELFFVVDWEFNGSQFWETFYQENQRKKSNLTFRRPHAVIKKSEMWKN